MNWWLSFKMITLELNLEVTIWLNLAWPVSVKTFPGRKLELGHHVLELFVSVLGSEN